jgi:hypothetical protein
MSGVTHATYGLLMEHGAWRASCGCGWRSTPSADLAAQTDELDAHLCQVLLVEQRPSRVEAAVTSSVLHVVDHPGTVGVLAVCLALVAPLVVRLRAA